MMILREKIASLIHESWMKWARSIMETESLSPRRMSRWEKHLVPYEDLDELTKNLDRMWADKIIDIILQKEVR